MNIDKQQAFQGHEETGLAEAKGSDGRVTENDPAEKSQEISPLSIRHHILRIGFSNWQRHAPSHLMIRNTFVGPQRSLNKKENVYEGLPWWAEGWPSMNHEEKAAKTKSFIKLQMWYRAVLNPFSHTRNVLSPIFFSTLCFLYF